MDILKLRAVLGLDKSKFVQGMQETEDEAKGFGSKLSGLVGGAAKGFAVVSAAAGAAAVAVGAIAKQAVSSYGETQQLVGGVETLFGSSAKKVLADADKAFQTAGMSANQYMETSIQSAAALINSLGGDQKQAAELMNTSIVDMADNVNKMGTSMEGVQNAYRGFSRGNFTMLDNLALGFSGTKEGMQELLDKAKEIDGYDYDIDKYSDIVKAIHTVQESMGISGTTAAEAAGTITGSVGSVKAAWENLVAGLADPKANLSKLINQVVQSSKVAISNLVPIFKQALTGVATLIKEMAPIISREFPGLINDVLPPLIDAATTLMVALVQNLPQIISVLIKAIPTVVGSIRDALKEAWPQISEAITNFLGTDVGKIVAMVTAGWAAIKGLGIVGSVANAISVIIPLISGLASSVGLIVVAIAAAAVAIIMNWDKIKAAWGKAVGFFGSVWNGIKSVFKDVGTWISSKFTSAYNTIQNTWKGIGTKFRQYRDSIWNAMKDVGSSIAERFTSARNSIMTGWSSISERFVSVRDAIMNIFKNLPEYFGMMGKNIITGLYNGVVERFNGLIENFKSIGKSVINIFNSIFKNASPSKVFKQIGGYLMEGMAIGIEDKSTLVESAMKDVSDMVFDNTPNLDMVAKARAESFGSASGGSYFSVPRQKENKQLTVILELDRMVLGRAVYNLNNDETQRVGVRLAGGIA